MLDAGEQGPDGVRGDHPPVGDHRVGHVERARDVTGDRVDRLGFAAVALRCPHVDELTDSGPCRGVVRVEGGDRSLPHGDVPSIGRDVVGRDGSGPRVHPAVEHPHGLDARPAQRPPRPCRWEQVAGVDDHDVVALVDAGATERRLEVGRVGEWVAALGARRSGEVGMEVHEHRAGDVAGVVGGAVGPTGQRPAHVEHDRRVVTGERVGQLVAGDQGGDQRGCHGPIIAGGGSFLTMRQIRGFRFTTITPWVTTSMQ